MSAPSPSGAGLGAGADRTANSAISRRVIAGAIGPSPRATVRPLDQAGRLRALQPEPRPGRQRPAQGPGGEHVVGTAIHGAVAQTYLLFPEKPPAEKPPAEKPPAGEVRPEAHGGVPRSRSRRSAAARAGGWDGPRNRR
ncbi:hypothetical protein [Streptomyces sp. NPDC093260]|uniref:hypothetical protein n=1 Tax=Streptomyces sp. NPDC093260 TaxID=3155073 RepID=UPI00343FC79C